MTERYKLLWLRFKFAFGLCAIALHIRVDVDNRQTQCFHAYRVENNYLASSVFLSSQATTMSNAWNIFVWSAIFSAFRYKIAECCIHCQHVCVVGDLVIEHVINQKKINFKQQISSGHTLHIFASPICLASTLPYQ